jgi:uncharacterized protein YhdP
VGRRGSRKLTARFKKWRRPDKASSDAEPGEILKELPALDIVVDDFTVGARRFGRLDVQAHNEGGIWRLDRIELLNPYGSLSATGSGRSAMPIARNSISRWTAVMSANCWTAWVTAVRYAAAARP